MPKTDDSDLRQIPLFSDLPAKQMPELRALLTTVRTSKTAEVMRAGSVGREFLVLKSGSGQVVKDATVVALLEPGDVIGEVSLLSNKPRNATVVIDAGSELMAANAAEFSTIVSKFPTVKERLEELAAARS